MLFPITFQLLRQQLSLQPGLSTQGRHFDVANFLLVRFHQSLLVDTTPLPEDIPQVKEVGASSAPLLSASFFIGDRCREYNDDYMQCKTEKPGRGEFDCMKEGRRVTRCASSVYVSPPRAIISSDFWRLQGRACREDIWG